MNSFILLTGASSGIGLELAKIFAANSHNLILVARSQDALEKLAQEIRAAHKVQVEVFSLDLSQPSAPTSLFKICQDKNLKVDTLVNNAGFGDNAAFSSSDWKKTSEMMDLNMKSLVHLTHLFLPGMLERKKGAILNTASTAAFQPGPYMAVYYASKSFVLSFSEALNEELRGSGVHVTALCPGPTMSGFQKAAGIESALLMKMGVPGSRVVAEYGYKALVAKKPVAVHGLLNNILVFTTRLTPRFLMVKIVRALQEKRLSKI